MVLLGLARKVAGFSGSSNHVAELLMPTTGRIRDVGADQGVVLQSIRCVPTSMEPHVTTNPPAKSKRYIIRIRAACLHESWYDYKVSKEPAYRISTSTSTSVSHQTVHYSLLSRLAIRQRFNFPKQNNNNETQHTKYHVVLQNYQLLHPGCGDLCHHRYVGIPYTRQAQLKLTPSQSLMIKDMTTAAAL
jgi:hypothetical protein